MLISGVRGDLCLAYANTRFWRGSPVPTEKLARVADLLSWLESSGGLAPEVLQEIAAWSQAHEKKAEALFDTAITLREALFRIFASLAGGHLAPAGDVAVLQTVLAAAPARRILDAVDGRYGWSVERVRPVAADLLAPVLWSAADLLLNAEQRRIRQCANDKCLWLFLDESKSGTRRWCDMTSCGNRAKAQRHYSKLKQV